ncbi:CDP-alcohol phosphatidyltransferase family protein [Novosphingopyxis sp. YJ-S2-01]|uniref:CDP-alcohol phosphatidyltransferase family protein n=1 Tax=Novosphingopyxis sp. YJ-S2-01 TaxID=2794021 RepID=UPI0018DC7BBF|nr:phosphatidylcholine/phosphatidylserine synthase [Novosphingopyxis sp. YJ-S2-01]MBH9538705.1 phosphatidylcholine/phosphatidylserine synthase [Novosphingopyxis sp. YJ-S2-01]
MAKGTAFTNAIPLRALVPNAVTALALCTGLSGVWFAISERWDMAVGAIIVAGILDGMDGRIARLLNGQSKFGAELDSLSDNIAFGVSPALITYLWSLQYMPKFGWTIALFYAVSCALRLARFNARIDMEAHPRKEMGFLTGVPAPAGAGLALLPIFIWLAFGIEESRSWVVTGPWLLASAALMVSSLPTFSWGSLRLRRSIRFEAIAVFVLLVAALIGAPFITLSVICVVYLALVPLAYLSYKKAMRRRGAKPGEAG